MWRTNRHLGLILAAAFALYPLGVSAQDSTSGRDRANAGAERREEFTRIQVTINLFFPGPTGESAEAVALRDRVRRSAYEMAANECSLVEQVLAKTCRLDSVNVSINANRQSSGQTEGYTASGNFTMRVSLK
jgi:hypothetical protein